MDTAALLDRLRGWRFGADIAAAIIVTAFALFPPVDVETASPLVATLAFVSIAIRSVSPGTALVAAWVMAWSQMLVNERPGFAAIAILLALYAAARLGSRIEVIASGVSALIGGLIATDFLIQSGTRYQIFAAGIPLAAAIAPVGVLASTWLAGFAVRSFRSQRHESERRVLAEDRTERALGVAEAEKLRADMARDVHDIVGHSLAVIIAQADSVQFLDDTARIRSVSATIADTARRSLHEVREVLSGMTADGAEDEPADLDTLVEQIRAAGVTVERSVRGAVRPLDVPHSVIVRRVAQEMLTNALRHGDPGAPIHLREVWRSADVVLEVENVVASGVPREDRPSGSGLGIPGMRTRVEAIGGSVEAEAVDGVFTARARVPVTASIVEPPFVAAPSPDVTAVPSDGPSAYPSPETNANPASAMVRAPGGSVLPGGSGTAGSGRAVIAP